MPTNWRRVSVAAGFAIIVTLVSGIAHAQDRCDAILEGDLFNRIFSETSGQSSSRAAIRSYLFRQSEDEAYDIYEREYENAISQGQAGSIGVNYFGIGGDADFEIDYSRKLSEAEFKDKFRRAKQVYQQNYESTTATENTLADSYASYVRDSNTIEAWKTCVTHERPIGIYAFGSRDETGTPYVNVIWVPGDLAPIYPSIIIDFELPINASIPNSNRSVAGGSGRTFRVEVPEAEKNIQLFVNAELRNARGDLLRSYSKVAAIPPIVRISETAIEEPDAPEPVQPSLPPPSPTNAMPNLVGQLGVPVVDLLSCVTLEPVDHCLDFLARDAGAIGVDRRVLADFFFVTTRSGVRPEVVWHDQQFGTRIVSQHPPAGTPVPPLGTFKIEISSTVPVIRRHLDSSGRVQPNMSIRDLLPQ